MSHKETPRPQEQVEHIAYQSNGTLIIVELWNQSEREDTVTCTRFEWAWNYVDETFTQSQYSLSFNLKEGTDILEHANKPWYTRARETIERAIELRPRLDSYKTQTDTEPQAKRWFTNNPHHTDIKKTIEGPPQTTLSESTTSSATLAQ